MCIDTATTLYATNASVALTLEHIKFDFIFSVHTHMHDLCNFLIRLKCDAYLSVHTSPPNNCALLLYLHSRFGTHALNVVKLIWNGFPFRCYRRARMRCVCRVCHHTVKLQINYLQWSNWYPNVKTTRYSVISNKDIACHSFIGGGGGGDVSWIFHTAKME